MNDMQHTQSDADRQPTETRPEPTSSPRVTLMARLRSQSGLVVLALVVLVAILVLTTQTFHVLALFPFAFILICPLMMWFMMRGMGGMGGGGNGKH